MPTYEFRCPKGHAFDRFFSKISDAPSDVACPECGEMAHRQISGGAGLLFKGSGFYLTDYGKNAHRGSAPKSDSGSGGESSGGESKSGESKPAAESASKTSESKPNSTPATAPDKSSGSTKSDSGKKSGGGSTT